MAKVTAVNVLRASFDASCDRLHRIVEGLKDDEFFWELVPGCWTVHRRTEIRAASADGSGEWVIDYVVPEPSPPPFTTIAWRLVHIAAINYLYYDYAFGSASLSFHLDIPATASSAVAWLHDSQAPLRDVLGAQDDRELAELVLTNWGEQWPCERIWRTLIDEQVHHGAEISLLRDLYRNRQLIQPFSE